jgi:hypothetical protein
MQEDRLREIETHWTELEHGGFTDHNDERTEVLELVWEVRRLNRILQHIENLTQQAIEEVKRARSN